MRPPRTLYTARRNRYRPPPGPPPKPQPCPNASPGRSRDSPALEPCDAGPASPSYQTSHMFLTH